MQNCKTSIAALDKKYLKIEPSFGDKLKGIAAGAFTLVATAISTVLISKVTNIPIDVILHPALIFGAYSAYEAGKKVMNDSAIRNGRASLNRLDF
jgi:hypothetical protein